MFLKISRAVNTSSIILGQIGLILLQREIFAHHVTKFQKNSQSHGTEGWIILTQIRSITLAWEEIF